MKPYLIVLLSVLFLSLSLACVAISFSPTTSTVRGSGNIIKKTVDVSNFDRIVLANSGDVYIEQGDHESLTIEADDNIMPLLVSEVKGSELVLDTKPNQSLNPSRKIIYRLAVKDMEGISLKGSGNFYVEPIQARTMSISLLGSGDINLKGLTSDTLSMDLFGSGNITINQVAAKTINTDAKGSGDITLGGKSDSQTISYSGSGKYMADDLESVSADIRVPGSADVTVWVRDQLKVHVDGSGTIRYYGKPTVDQSGAGSGKISSLGEK
jgi:hypothetical protein